MWPGCSAANSELAGVIHVVNAPLSCPPQKKIGQVPIKDSCAFSSLSCHCLTNVCPCHSMSEDPGGLSDQEISMEVPSYNVGEPADLRESIPLRPMRVGNAHTLLEADGSPLSVGDRTLRKGPFVYREWVHLSHQVLLVSTVGRRNVCLLAAINDNRKACISDNNKSTTSFHEAVLFSNILCQPWGHLERRGCWCSHCLHACNVCVHSVVVFHKKTVTMSVSMCHPLHHRASQAAEVLLSSWPVWVGKSLMKTHSWRGLLRRSNLLKLRWEAASSCCSCISETAAEPTDRTLALIYAKTNDGERAQIWIQNLCTANCMGRHFCMWAFGEEIK